MGGKVETAVLVAAVAVIDRVGVIVTVDVTDGVGVRDGVDVWVAVGVFEGAAVEVGVCVAVAVRVGVDVWVGVAVGVSVGVAVQILTGQVVGVKVGVDVHVAGRIVWVTIGAGGVPVPLTGLIALLSPPVERPRMLGRTTTASSAMKMPPPMKIMRRVRGCSLTRRLVAGFNRSQPGPDEVAAGSIGWAAADCAVARAATCADNFARRCSTNFCKPGAAVGCCGLIATTWRKNSSRSASSLATALNHNHAVSLRGSAIMTKLSISRALSLMPRWAA